MSRRACTFRQQDVTRAIKAVTAAGTKVARVEIDKAGKIVLIAESPGTPKHASDTENEWPTK